MKFLAYSSRFLFWTSLLLAPAARGAMVQYDVQIDVPASQRDPAFTLHVEFVLPDFLQHTGPVTSLLMGTSSIGLITAFDLSLDSTPCDLLIDGNGGHVGLGPCYVANTENGGAVGQFFIDSSSPGMYLGSNGNGSIIIDITPVNSAVPEPSMGYLIVTATIDITILAHKRRCKLASVDIIKVKDLLGRLQTFGNG